MHHDVGAQLERLLKHRRREGVVDDDERARLVRGLTQRRDVVDEKPWVGRRLDPHEPRARTERASIGLTIRHVHLADDTAERLVDPGEQPVCAAVDVERNHNLVARLQPRLQDGVLRGKARPVHGGAVHAFEVCEHRLQTGARGVVRARVVKPLMYARRFLLIC